MEGVAREGGPFSFAVSKKMGWPARCPDGGNPVQLRQSKESGCAKAFARD